MLTLQARIMALGNGVALEIALPQGGIILLGSGEMRFCCQFDIPDQPP